MSVITDSLITDIVPVIGGGGGPVVPVDSCVMIRPEIIFTIVDVDTPPTNTYELIDYIGIEL